LALAGFAVELLQVTEETPAFRPAPGVSEATMTTTVPTPSTMLPVTTAMTVAPITHSA